MVDTVWGSLVSWSFVVTWLLPCLTPGLFKSSHPPSLLFTLSVFTVRCLSKELLLLTTGSVLSKPAMNWEVCCFISSFFFSICDCTSLIRLSVCPCSCFISFVPLFSATVTFCFPPSWFKTDADSTLGFVTSLIIAGRTLLDWYSTVLERCCSLTLRVGSLISLWPGIEISDCFITQVSWCKPLAWAATNRGNNIQLFVHTYISDKVGGRNY